MNFEMPNGLSEQAEQIEILQDGVLREIITPIEYQKLGRSLEKSETMIGEPEKDAELWHLQNNKASCAVVCQEFVAEALLGEEYVESRMLEYAEKHGLFSENGTFPEDVGKLLENMGLEVTQEYNCTEQDLRQVLEQGGKAIVGVSCMALAYPSYALRPGLRADHAVEVIGMDYSNPRNVQVILNDPGRSDGAGRVIKLKKFIDAWNTSGRFMTSVFR